MPLAFLGTELTEEGLWSDESRVQIAAPTSLKFLLTSQSKKRNARMIGCILKMAAYFVRQTWLEKRRRWSPSTVAALVRRLAPGPHRVALADGQLCTLFSRDARKSLVNLPQSSPQPSTAPEAEPDSLRSRHILAQLWTPSIRLTPESIRGSNR